MDARANGPHGVTQSGERAVRNPRVDEVRTRVGHVVTVGDPGSTFGVTEIVWELRVEGTIRVKYVGDAEVAVPTLRRRHEAKIPYAGIDHFSGIAWRSEGMLIAVHQVSG